MLIAINKFLIGKPEKGDEAWRLYSDTFESCDISLGKLAELVNKGYAFCAPYKNGKRNTVNFEAAGFLAIDVDKELNLDVVREDNFFKRYGGLIYTTASHTPWKHHFRIVFELENPVTDEKRMRAALTGLMLRFKGDEACKDACRMFCGSVNADEIILLDNKLPDQVLEELILSGEEAPVISHYRDGGLPATNRTSITLSPDLPIQTAMHGWMPFKDVPLATVVYCPKHTDDHPSAFVLQSLEKVKGVRCSSCCRTYFMETALSRRLSTRYDFNYSWESSLRAQAQELEREIEIFEDRTGIGYEPTVPERQDGQYSHRVLNENKFGSDHHLSYDPIFIHLKQRHITAASVALRHPKFTDDFMLYPDKGLSMREALLRRETGAEYQDADLDFIVEEKAIRNWLQQPCITLIKSPKGSGKTELMQSIVEHYDAYEDMSKKVLLIGHRRPLINATVKRFNEAEIDFISYLKTEQEKKAGKDKSEYNPPSNKYAICLDSMPRLLEPRRHQYDVVIIDEVEQVLSHLLSDTMKLGRDNVILWLRQYLRKAKHIFLLDADLNKLTADIMLTLVGDELKKDVFYVINTYQAEARKLYLHKSKDGLIGKMQMMLNSGKRCFLCANSKRLAKSLHKEITKLFPNLKVILITGDNSSDEDSQFFINNIKTEAKKYDLIVVSPSLGTGIDITFPNHQQHIDAVFGVFEARVNTHFDIDQQLSRVRDPGEINVWITHEEFNFETDANVIFEDIQSMKNEFRTIRSLDEDGSPIYYEHRESEILYEKIYAAVSEVRRASINKLRYNFRKLREANGWTVEDVDTDENLRAIGKELRERGKKRHQEEERLKILNAMPINDTQFKIIDKKPDDSRDESEKNSWQKYKIEEFYNMEATHELLMLDSDWRLRKAIALYDSLFLSEEELLRKEVSRYSSMFIDAKNYRLVAKALKDLLGAAGYWKNGGIDIEATIHKDQMQPFIAACKRHKGALALVFEIDVRDDEALSKNPIQQLGSILKETLMLSNKKADGKTRDCTYRLDKSKLEILQKWHAQHIDEEKRAAWERRQLTATPHHEFIAAPPEIQEFIAGKLKDGDTELPVKAGLREESATYSVIDVDED